MAGRRSHQRFRCALTKLVSAYGRDARGPSWRRRAPGLAVAWLASNRRNVTTKTRQGLQNGPRPQDSPHPNLAKTSWRRPSSSSGALTGRSARATPSKVAKTTPRLTPPGFSTRTA